jgi:RNA polymerase sigma-70 factor (ECF subfamily)
MNEDKIDRWETRGSTSTSLSLIARVQQQDSGAWQQFVALYGPLIQFWCCKYGLDHHAAQDCLQDVLLAVSRSIDSFHASLPTSRLGSADTAATGSFRSWLWTVTRHKIIDYQRRQARSPRGRGGSTALNVLGQLPELPDWQEASEQSEFNKLLRRALSQVRNEFEPKTWSAFYRSTVDGLAVAVVADQLGLSPAAVRQYRSRILRRLREQLGDR